MISESRLPELYQFIMDDKSDPIFKDEVVTMIVSALQVAKCVYLRQEHYDPATGQFTISEKTDNHYRLSLMKPAGRTTNIFPPGVQDMINAQMLEGHEYVFIFRSKHGQRLRVVAIPL